MAQARQGGAQVVGGIDGREPHGGNAGAVQEGLLLQAVLGDPQGPRIWRDRRAQLRQLVQGDGRHVLELEGDDVGGLRQRFQTLWVVIGGDDGVGGDAGRRGVGLGVEDGDVEAKARGGQGQHAAKLAAAQDSDGRAGRQGIARWV